MKLSIHLLVFGGFEAVGTDFSSVGKTEVEGFAFVDVTQKLDSVPQPSWTEGPDPFYASSVLHCL